MHYNFPYLEQSDNQIPTFFRGPLTNHWLNLSLMIGNQSLLEEYSFILAAMPRVVVECWDSRIQHRMRWSPTFNTSELETCAQSCLIQTNLPTLCPPNFYKSRGTPTLREDQKILGRQNFELRNWGTWIWIEGRSLEWNLWERGCENQVKGKRVPKSLSLLPSLTTPMASCILHIHHIKRGFCFSVLFCISFHILL